MEKDLPRVIYVITNDHDEEIELFYIHEKAKERIKDLDQTGSHYWYFIKETTIK